MNVVNYNHVTKYVRLRSVQQQSFSAVDLISGEFVSPEFPLPPLKPMLIKITFN